MRRLIEQPGPEHEHEPAGAAVRPVHVPDAADAGLDGAPHHVETHGIADVDAEAFAQAPEEGRVTVLLESLRERFRINVGDTVRFDVMGRTVEARVSSVRHVDWSGQSSAPERVHVRLPARAARSGAARLHLVPQSSRSSHSVSPSAGLNSSRASRTYR